MTKVTKICISPKMKFYKIEILSHKVIKTNITLHTHK